MCALFKEHQRKVSAQLFDAIRAQDMKMAKVYVEDGAEMDFKDKWGDTALHQCAVYVRTSRSCTRPTGTVAVSSHLGTSVLQHTLCAVVAMLCRVLSYNQAAIAKELVFHRADPNTENSMGMTPLMVVRAWRNDHPQHAVCAALVLFRAHAMRRVSFVPVNRHFHRERRLLPRHACCRPCGVSAPPWSTLYCGRGPPSTPARWT